MGVKAPVVGLGELNGVPPVQAEDAREGFYGVRRDVRQAVHHAFHVHLIEAAPDNVTGVLLLEVVGRPVEQDVHGLPLSQVLPADILDRDLGEAHAGGNKVPLVSAQDFPAAVCVDRQQEAQLSEGQLRQGQALFIIPPGVVLRCVNGFNGYQLNHFPAASS